MDATGQPSVGLQAGGQARVSISAATPGGEIQVGPREGRSYALLKGLEAGPSLSLVTRGQNVLSMLSDGVGARVIGADKDGDSRFELKVDKAAGTLQLLKPDGKLYAEFEYSGNDGGSLQLMGDDRSRRAEIYGEGMVVLKEDGKVKTTLPPRSDD